MKIKTSTRVSILFSIFTFFIIFLLLIILNIVLFFSWYNNEINELKESNSITDIINQAYKEFINEEIESSGDKTLKSLLNYNLFETKDKKINGYKNLLLNIYSKDDKIFIIYKNDNGTLFAPYDITSYFKEQIQIIILGVFLLCLFTFLSFILSKSLFIKGAFKDIFFISDELKKININDINNINLKLHKNDEINIILKSINNFLEIIKKNNDSLQHFNSQVAHEFKTPLMVISSELEFLSLNGEKNESIKRIEYQIKKMDSLLSHFLLLTKIQNGKKINIKNIDISVIIDKEIKTLSKNYIDKKINIVNNIQTSIFYKGNKDFIQIIIKNILENSFKYNKKGGSIIIDFKKDCLTIKDNGIGIKDENIEKIWDNLYRENDFGKGYGVGLNLVKQICDIMGYEISVKSKEGIGTKFTIKFK